MTKAEQVFVSRMAPHIKAGLSFVDAAIQTPGWVIICYGNGLAENPSNSLWIIAWPDKFWD